MDLEEIKNLPTETNEENEEDKIIQLYEVEETRLARATATGFSSLDDKMLGGLRGGDLMIISGISGSGKSHLTLQMMKSFSDNQQPTLLFTYEERPERIKWRLQQMGVEVNNEFLTFLPLQNTKNTVEWIENKILDGLNNYMIKIIVIDNLDFLTAEQQKGTDDKWSMQSRVVGMLKRVANEHNVTILLNAHVSRNRENRDPRMEDLYGSGDTYKLADFVLFIKQEEQNAIFDDESKEQVGEEFIAKLILDKNRLTGKKGYINIKSTNGIYVER